MANNPKRKTPNFEQNLSDIDSIIKTMESNQVPLDESVALFEKGTRLIQQCQESLKKAEQTVTTLMSESADQND